MKLFTLLICSLSLVLFVSCGKNTTNSREYRVQEAKTCLDQRDYERCISLLENMSDDDLRASRADDLLAYAYLGALGYDIDSLFQIVNQVTEFSFNKANQESIFTATAVLPDFTDQTYLRLSRALSILERSIALESKGAKYKQFVLGNLYAFRILARVKELAEILALVNAKDSQPKQKISPILIGVIEDYEQLKNHYQASYQKLKKFIDSFQNSFSIGIDQ